MNSWENFLKSQGNRGSNKELDLVSFIEYSDMNSWENFLKFQGNRGSNKGDNDNYAVNFHSMASSLCRLPCIARVLEKHMYYIMAVM